MVELAPIGQNEYQAWLANSAREYAVEKVEAGNWEQAEAQARSEQEFARLLPDGPETPNNYIYSIVAPTQAGGRGVPVGVIWFAVPDWKPRIAFIYDFVIYPEYRRQGYGEQALRAIEEQVKALGLDTIVLHVFGHNHGARALYAKLGYAETNVNMAKKLRD